MKFGFLIFAAIFADESSANNSDVFNYGMDRIKEDNGPTSYGQDRWEDVTCDDLDECVSFLRWPTSFTVRFYHTHILLLKTSSTPRHTIVYLSNRLATRISILSPRDLISTKTAISASGAQKEEARTVGFIVNLRLIFIATAESLGVKTKKNVLTGTGCSSVTTLVPGKT